MTAWLLTIACAAATFALVLAERRHAALPWRAVFKLAASSAFIALAWVLGAAGSAYGKWVLVGLCLSWVGDACLLSERPTPFLLGLGAFLLGHVAFAAAFVAAGIDARALAIAALPLLLFGALVLRWLLPQAPAGMRLPVLAYVLVILAMCALAIAHGVHSDRLLPALGAVLFAASDLLVARQQFVHKAWHNKAIGLPLYFAAQCLLAWSVRLSD